MMMIASYVGRWAQIQQEQLQLCEAIDQLADRLPLYDIDAFGALAGRLKTVLDRAQSYEEGELFPRLEAISPQMRPLLGTFRNHHARDRRMGQSVAKALDASLPNAADLKDLQSELTAFAEALRRHVQFEEAITMALFASKRVDEKRAIQ